MADKPITPPLNQSGWVPVPDPTTRTAEQLSIAITALREVIETRLNGMDRAMELLQAITDQMPSRIDEKIASLEKVHEEKFASIQLQFKERDVRDERSTRDSKTAVDAALQAAKEAVGEQNKSSALAIAKSEAATDKRIDQQSLLLASATKGLDDKIESSNKTRDSQLGDVKERLTRIEGKGEGVVKQAAQGQWMVGTAIAVVALLVSLALLFAKFQAAAPVILNGVKP